MERAVEHGPAAIPGRWLLSLEPCLLRGPQVGRLRSGLHQLSAKKPLRLGEHDGNELPHLPGLETIGIESKETYSHLLSALGSADST